MRPHVPGIAMEAVDFDIGDDHPHLFAGLAFESYPSLLTDNAVAAVTADEPARGDCLGFAVPLASSDQHGRHALVRLLEADECNAEIDRTAELRQPQSQRFLDPPFGRDQAGRIRNVRTTSKRIGATPLGYLTVESGLADWHCHPAVGDHAFDDAEIVEHLERARLESLAARARLWAGDCFDEAQRGSAPGEFAGQRQPGRAGANDQHRHHILIRFLTCHPSDSSLHKSVSTLLLSSVLLRNASLSKIA